MHDAEEEASQRLEACAVEQLSFEYSDSELVWTSDGQKEREAASQGEGARRRDPRREAA